MLYQVTFSAGIVGNRCDYGGSSGCAAHKEVKWNLPRPRGLLQQRNLVVPILRRSLRERCARGPRTNSLQLFLLLRFTANLIQALLALKRSVEFGKGERIVHEESLLSVRKASNVPPKSNPAARADEVQAFFKYTVGTSGDGGKL